MAKDKKSSKVAAAAPVASKPLDSVKDGRVSKSVKSSKPEVKPKKARDPSPESSDDESDGTSDSSDSSDEGSDSEQEVDSKINGKAKDDPGSDADSDSDSDSDSSASDSEDEAGAKKAVAPKVNGTAKIEAKADKDVPKTNGKAKATADDDESASSDSSDSGSDSDSDSDSGSDGEADTKAGAEKTADDSSSASSSDDEAEVPAVKAEEVAKKRKAEAPIEQTPKKAKVNSSEGQSGVAANLFIGNLSWNVDEEWLTREFEDFGEIKGVRVITDRDSGRSKGYGYVEFNEVDSAVQALEVKNGAQLDGRNIRVDYSTPRPQKNYDGSTPAQRGSERAQRFGDVQKPPTATLFVGNVSFNADEGMLTELFQDYGTITAVRLPTDRETGSLKGFGYVEYTSIDESKAALEALNGHPLEGRPIRLDFAGERSNDSPRGGGFSRGAPRGRGGFSDRGGRGGFGDRGRGRGGARGGRGGTTNRGGFGDFSGKKISF